MTDAVTILGSGSALPTYQNSPSGQMLTLNDKSFLIDCGEGVQLTMRQMGLKTARLYSIFISQEMSVIKKSYQSMWIFNIHSLRWYLVGHSRRQL